jgi:hypothetical protein
MAVGAIAMSLSTIIVAANAQLLRRLKLRSEPVIGAPGVPAGERRDHPEDAEPEGRPSAA